MRDQGIEANATLRRARGIVKKAQKQAVRHIDRDHATMRPCGHQAQDPGQSYGQPTAASLRRGGRTLRRATRKDVQRAYGQIARELAKGDGDDKRLAVDIVTLVQQMPLPLSKHEQRVQALQEAGRSHGESAGREHGRRTGATPERAAQLYQQQAQKLDQGRDIKKD